MATTRQIGNLTIHFLGDNAAQLESMFADVYSRSEAPAAACIKAQEIVTPTACTWSSRLARK